MSDRIPIIHIEIDPSINGRYEVKYTRDFPCVFQNVLIQIENNELSYVSEEEIQTNTHQANELPSLEASNKLLELKSKLQKFSKFQEIGYIKSQATFVKTLAEAYVEDFQAGKSLIDVAFDVSMKTLLVVHSSLENIEIEERQIIIQEVQLLANTIRQTSSPDEGTQDSQINQILVRLRDPVRKLAEIISSNSIASADLIPVITTPMRITIKGSHEDHESMFNIKLLSDTTLKLLAKEHDRNSDLTFETKVDTCIQRAEYLFSNDITNHPLLRDDFDVTKNDNKLHD